MINATFEQQIKNKLTSLATQISQDDRDAAATHLDVNVVTVDKYLSGNVNKILFADGLIAFLEARISERGIVNITN